MTEITWTNCVEQMPPDDQTIIICIYGGDAIYCSNIRSSNFFLFRNCKGQMITLTALYLCAIWAMSVWAISAVIEMTIEDDAK